jgi:hypothetical protein
MAHRRLLVCIRVLRNLVGRPDIGNVGRGKKEYLGGVRTMGKPRTAVPSPNHAYIGADDNKVDGEGGLFLSRRYSLWTGGEMGEEGRRDTYHRRER